MLSDTRHNHVLIVEDDQGRHKHILEAPVYLIGRDPKCDIRLISQFVSRCHARLIQVPHDDGSFSYSIVDGNEGKPSANGLLINGRKLQAYKLQHEDEIMFGRRFVQPITYSGETAIARLQATNRRHPLVAVAEATTTPMMLKWLP